MHEKQKWSKMCVLVKKWVGVSKSGCTLCVYCVYREYERRLKVEASEGGKAI
jgi:hypothetical protein